ncbi:MAG: cold shock domain-containing protein [Saprospiraceae bacterium]|nr:cold shock domain-containing protein [Saprospiraceae bacterium]
MLRNLLKNVNSWFSKEKTGKIKFFNRKKGYGFIETPHSDQDIFVHASHLTDRISKGDRVSFRITQTEKGPEAREVARV